MPDFGGKRLITLGLAGLALQTVDLRVDLLQHIVDAGEIVFGRFQPKLGLVAAAMQPCNTCCIFKNTAAGAGLGVDDFADLALAHHGGRAGTRGGIGKQKLHVTGADFAAIHPVDGAVIPLDTTGDFEHLGIVEGGGRFAVLIVDGQRYFGHITGRAIAAACENHVIHAGGTQGFMRAFAHNPAQGLDQIGFAAAIRPDNAG